MLEQQAKVPAIRKFLGQIYNSDRKGRVDMNEFSDEEVMTMANNLRAGVPMATPVFDGAAESEIKQLLTLAELQHRDSYLNVRNALIQIHEYGAIAVVNEND